jgi:hypothetical protein
MSITALAAQEPAQAETLLASYAALRHPALNAARYILARVRPSCATRLPEASCAGDDSLTSVSVHPLGPWAFAGWLEFFMGLLRAK